MRKLFLCNIQIFNMLKNIFYFTQKLSVFVGGNYDVTIGFDLIIDIQTIANSETLVSYCLVPLIVIQPSTSYSSAHV